MIGWESWSKEKVKYLSCIEGKGVGGKDIHCIVQNVKIYSMIDQQIARHFVHYSESLYNPLSFYITQITLFLNSRISANQDKGLGF